MALRDQFEDLKYLISKDNKTSRGFYLLFTVISVILLVATLAMEVAAIAGVSTGMWRIMGFAGFPVVLILLFICVTLLSK